jgi:hypothetical protein
VDRERAIVFVEAAVIVAGEPDNGPELAGTEIHGFDAVVQEVEVDDAAAAVRANVADEGEEPLRRLPAVVGEEEGSVGGDAAPGLADGAAPDDRLRRQAEQHIQQELSREVDEGNYPSPRRRICDLGHGRSPGDGRIYQPYLDLHGEKKELGFQIDHQT